MNNLATPPQSPDLSLTRRQLAARWSCSPQRLANLAYAGTGPAFFKIGQAVRYRVSDVVAYEEAHMQMPLAA